MPETSLEGSESEQRGRQVIVDFSEKATVEVDRLEKITGLPVSGQMRAGLSLLRQVLEAESKGGGLIVMENVQRPRPSKPQ